MSNKYWLYIWVTWWVSNKRQKLLTRRPGCLRGIVLLISLVFCVVLLCVFTFIVPCSDVRYDFRIKTMFSSPLPPVVCRRADVLITLFVFACVYWCVLFCFSSSCVLCARCCRFLWIVHCLISPSVFSNACLAHTTHFWNNLH